MRWAVSLPSALVLLVGAALASPPAAGRAALLEHQVKALEWLAQAAAHRKAGEAGAFAESVKKARVEVDALAQAELPQKADLASMSRDLQTHAEGSAPAGDGFAYESHRAVLEAVGKSLSRRASRGLDFQGSYTQPIIEEPAAGGHASAMGPPVLQVSSREDLRSTEEAPVELVSRPGQLTRKMYGGGAAKDHILESGAGGVALFDYDGDGRLDIFTVGTTEIDAKRERVTHPSGLYRNLGGWKFEEVSKEAGLEVGAWGQGVCAGDFDDDGQLDLYVTNYGPNFLFKNKGDGTFTEVGAAAGVTAGNWSTGCAFFDADGDGDLDLYVARYMTVSWEDVVKAERTMKWRGGPSVMVGPVGLPGAADIFYENRGDGTFVEATEARGLKDAAGSYGFAVVPTDYDADGDVDLFVANDSNPNFLYQNDGTGRFESVGLLAGVAVNREGRSQAGMGADAGDYDGDGQLDLVLTTFAHDTVSLYRNVGGGQFEDASQASGVAARTYLPMEWGVAFFDADQDGDLDLFLANGHLYPQVDEAAELGESYRQKSQLLVNDGGKFRDVSDQAGSGLAESHAARGLAVGDLDDDGDLDLVVTNVDDVPTLLENRPRRAGHWVGLSLVKPAGRNRFAIGARVTLAAGDRRQIREVRSGGSFLSQSDRRVFFGLGSHAGPIDVEVALPGQGRWMWKALPADRLHALVLDDEHRVAAGAP
jgi:hypothetical protein